jgi:hypothetical protein
MALQILTFPTFTPAMWQAFITKIKGDTGVEITAASGTVTHGSFVFNYTYNSTQQVLEVQCLKKPLFIPASTINNGLKEEIAELITTVQNAPPPSPLTTLVAAQTAAAK